jgi:hypothetical protein
LIKNKIQIPLVFGHGPISASCTASQAFSGMSLETKVWFREASSFHVAERAFYGDTYGDHYQKITYSSAFVPDDTSPVTRI